jgi:choline dehydrogenase-like flavoprotein
VPQRFDYVIVGAGSAGCALANRLSEDPATSVLLLEAGPRDRAKEIRIPAAFSKLFKSKFDWGYETVPQAGLDGRRIYFPRGKVLGGSSAMNAMMWIPGDRVDFDSWPDGWRMGGPPAVLAPGRGGSVFNRAAGRPEPHVAGVPEVGG